MYVHKYRVDKMDCPSEENLIRLKLQAESSVKHLEFDLAGRQLYVYSDEADAARVTLLLEPLNLDARLLATEIADERVATTPVDDSAFQARQKRALWIVLAINLAFFAIEMVTGYISESMGLVADSLDMLSDGIVYGLSLMAVGASVARKKRVAKFSGFFQIALALLGFVEVVERVFGAGTIPDYSMMIVISCFALAANAACLYILQKTKSRDAHIRASIIFSSNDIFINAGVICAGLLVKVFGSQIPDLVVGSIVFVIVIIGAMRILKLAK